MIDKIIKSIVDEKLFDTHTCVLGRVVNVSTNTLDVQPLPKRKYKDGRREDYPLLTRLPFTKRKANVTIPQKTINVSGGYGSVNIPEETLEIDFVPYERNDIVVVVFSEKSIDGVGNRRHSLSDGLVVGRVDI